MTTPTASVVTKPHWKISFACGINYCPIFFNYYYDFFRPTSVSILWTCAYIHEPELYMTYRCYQIIQWVKHFYKNLVRCGVDWINITGAPAWRWLAELRDNGQKVLQSSFQTGSSSKPNYFPIFFLTAFVQEAFITNITIPHIKCIIITCINNTLTL